MYINHNALRYGSCERIQWGHIQGIGCGRGCCCLHCTWYYWLGNGQLNYRKWVAPSIVHGFSCNLICTCGKLWSSLRGLEPYTFTHTLPSPSAAIPDSYSSTSIPISTDTASLTWLQYWMMEALRIQGHTARETQPFQCCDPQVLQCANGTRNCEASVAPSCPQRMSWGGVCAYPSQVSGGLSAPPCICMQKLHHCPWVMMQFNLILPAAPQGQLCAFSALICC